MAIRFKCPHCQKPLSVKNEFAGKKGTCPACKKGLTIPAPAPVSAPVDVEALAAAALTEEPAAPVEKKPPTKIDFTCPFCDAPVQFGADLAGKQAPCPECRRIIKVPQLVKDEPVDWRKPATGRGPSGARRQAEPAPEGAWDSSLQTRRVSQQALEEAGVIVEEREPWSPRAKVYLIGGTTVGVIALATLVWVGLGLRNQSRQNQALESALTAVATDGSQPKLGPERDAAILLAAGEFALRTGQRDCATKARERFANARASLAEADSLDRDMLLADLALAQLELGGSNENDLDKGRRLKWDEAQKEVTRTLLAIRSPEIKEEAVRVAARRLIEQRQPQRIRPLASQACGAASGAELLAVAGLELLRSDRSAADALCMDAFGIYETPPPPPAVDNTSREPQEIDLGKKPPPEENKKRPPPPALMALGTALEKKELLEHKGSELAGHLEGLAYRDPAEARRQAGQMTLGRLRVLVGIAAATSDPADGEAAVAWVEAGGRGEMTPGLLRRLLGLVGKQPAAAERLAKAISDSRLRGWAQLAAVRSRLAEKKDRAEESLADGMEKERLPYALALEAIARHNARLDNRVPAAVDGWDEKLQPFGRAGAALGMQDRSR